jgi:hypothetical protein
VSEKFEGGLNRGGEVVGAQERRLLEQAKSHLAIVGTQITRTERYLNEYAQKPSAQNWRLMMSELEALAKLPTLSALLIGDLERAMKMERSGGWPAGTKAWTK